MIIILRKNTFLLLTLVSFFHAIPILGQNTFRIEAYKDSIGHATKEIEKARFLNRLAAEFRSGFPDSTLFYAAAAARIAKDSNQPEFIRSLNQQGIANTTLGNSDKAIENYIKAIQLSQEINDSLLLAESQDFLSRHYLETGNLADAFENLSQARITFEKEKDLIGMSEVYLSLSDLFKSQHDYANALTMGMNALELKKRIHDQNGIIAALNIMGTSYRLTGDFSQAETSYREAESLAGDIEDEANLAVVKVGLGELYLESGSLSKAESEAFRAENILQRLTNPGIISRSNVLLGRIFLKKKNYRQAETYFLKALELSSKLSQLAIFMEANFYMARVHELTGRDASASIYESQYRSLNDSIRNNALALQAEKFNFELTIKTREQENELLKATEQKNEATIKFQQAINIGALLVIFLVVFFSYFLWQSTRARKKVNKKLNVQNQQLTDLIQEKDALMGIVAHDLKTPLSNIKSILGMLPGFGALSSKQIEFTELIKTSSHEGLALIDELLDAHALESQAIAKFTEVDVSKLLQNRVSHFTSVATNKKIQIVFEVEDGVAMRTDPDWLGRVVDNLLSNAIKFSPAGKEIKVNAGYRDNEVWIAIKDNGPGFSAEDKKRAFQKFQKLSAKPTGGETSNGLGLSIVKTLVERLKGNIALRSEVGQGSEFIIRFPK